MDTLEELTLDFDCGSTPSQPALFRALKEVFAERASRQAPDEFTGAERVHFRAILERSYSRLAAILTRQDRTDELKSFERERPWQ